MSDSIAPSENEGRKVLRTQNQTRADKAMSPVPPPIQDETVASASLRRSPPVPARTIGWPWRT
jgi:hypothetical protein